MGDAIYDKQEAETAKAYAAFAAYRDMGPHRSVDGAYLKLRENCGKTAGQKATNEWWKWASAFDWKKRAEAFDADADKKRREETAETFRLELEAYREETVLRARKLARIANELLDAVIDKMADPKFVSDLTSRDAALLARAAGGEIERATRIEGIGLGVLSETGELLEAKDN